MHVRLTKDFSFEAAQTLPNVPPGHKCGRMHGHSFKVEISVEGETDPTTGWLYDHSRISRAMDPLLEKLDHSYLNESRDWRTRPSRTCADGSGNASIRCSRALPRSSSTRPPRPAAATAGSGPDHRHFMVLDSLRQGARYHPLHPGMPAALRWIEERAATVNPGRYEVADGVTAIVDSYTTAPASEKKWETHRVHADLQIVLSGKEMVGWSPAAALTVSTPYNPEKDAEFYEPPVSPVARFLLHPGLLAIFFPDDGHQPGVMDGERGGVRKVVFKLPTLKHNAACRYGGGLLEGVCKDMTACSGAPLPRMLMA